MGDGRILLYISAPLPLIKTYLMTPLSARSISMDSTFNPLPHGVLATFSLTAGGLIEPSKKDDISR